MLYLGIDQHRKQLTVNIRDEQGDVVLKRQVSTEWDRVRKFLEDLRQRAELVGGFMAIVEICGFNDWLLEMLNDYGCRETVLIQPEKKSRKKTDRRDASALSQLLWVNRQRVLGGKKVQGLKRIILPSQEEQDNRQLTALRQRTAALRTRTINKVQHILLKHNLQQECPTKGMKTKKARQWLAELSLGEVDRLEMDQLLSRWELWDVQIAKIDAKIQERQQKHKTAPILATLPGASAYSSLALASRIGAIENFPRPGSLANYWGLTPGCRNSGDATDLNEAALAPARRSKNIFGVRSTRPERLLTSRRIHEGMDWGAAARKRSVARNLARTNRDNCWPREYDNDGSQQNGEA